MMMQFAAGCTITYPDAITIPTPLAKVQWGRGRDGPSVNQKL
jgi:hypothetical protein